MAKPFVVATLVYSHLGAIAAGLAGKVDKVIAKAAFDIEAEAKANITEAGAIDTGSAKDSIYANTPLKSDYAERTAEALSDNPGVALHPEEQRGDHEAVVSVGVEHGAYVELGTVRMPARPYLGPAADTMSESFKKSLGQVFER